VLAYLHIVCKTIPSAKGYRFTLLPLLITSSRSNITYHVAINNLSHFRTKLCITICHIGSN